MRLIFLDTGPLGLISNPRAMPQTLRCRQWARELLTAGVRIFVPEIADYEVRRGLLRVRVTAGLPRLDLVKAGLEFSPITSDIMLRAAELWAYAYQIGRPTASKDALDGDCILAAHALLAAGPGDVVTVATGNVGHLGRFVDAQLWETITG
jgi:predicted nucleic acid-binding protein